MTRTAALSVWKVLMSAYELHSPTK